MFITLAFITTVSNRELCELYSSLPNAFGISGLSGKSFQIITGFFFVLFFLIKLLSCGSKHMHTSIQNVCSS